MNMTMMKKILEDQRFSLPLAARALSVIQPKMLKQGIRVFPVVALIGKSSCGKTELFRAVLEDEGCEFAFFSKPAQVVESLQENRDSLCLVDDFAKLTSDSDRRKQSKIMDTVVRMAHKGELGIIGVTMESPARKYLAESCANRMLFVEIGNGVDDPEFSCMLSHLQETKDLDRLMLRFAEFVENSTDSFYQQLLDYRTQKKANQRLVAMLFSYHLVMNLINQFLMSEGYGGLDMSKIAQIEESFFEKKVAVGDDANAELAELLLRRLINSGEIIAQVCSVVDECSIHLKEGCKHRQEQCECGICKRGYHEMGIFENWHPSYSPNDLFLDYSSGTNALLIQDPKMIPHFNRPFHVPPFLIMEANLLTERINRVLADHCRETKQNYFYFTHETLRKSLLKVNRCVVMPNKDSGFRYTIPYYSVNESECQSVRAVLILLRKDEVDVLSEVGIRTGMLEQMRRWSNSDYCHSLLHVISTEWPKLAIKSGPIGELVIEI